MRDTPRDDTPQPLPALSRSTDESELSKRSTSWRRQGTKFVEGGSAAIFDVGSERLENAYFHPDKPLTAQFFCSYVPSVTEPGHAARLPLATPFCMD